jgi:hypothetical protein
VFTHDKRGFNISTANGFFAYSHVRFEGFIVADNELEIIIPRQNAIISFFIGCSFGW